MERAAFLERCGTVDLQPKWRGARPTASTPSPPPEQKLLLLLIRLRLKVEASKASAMGHLGTKMQPQSL